MLRRETRPYYRRAKQIVTTETLSFTVRAQIMQTRCVAQVLELKRRKPTKI